MRPTALLLILLWPWVLAGPVFAEEEGTASRLAALDAKARSEGRALAGELRIAPADLGAGWRLPWQLPEDMYDRAASEDAYWKKVRLFPAAFGEADAEAWLALALPRALERVAEDRERDAHAVSITDSDEKSALIVLLMMSRLHPPAETTALMLQGLHAAADRRLAKLQGNGASPKATGSSDEALYRALTERWHGLSEAALRRHLLRALTAVERRTELKYYKSNDWKALSGASGASGDAPSGRGAKTASAWMGTATVHAVVMDPDRLQDFPDVTAKEAAALEVDFNAALRTLDAKAKAVQRAEHERRLRKLQEVIDEVRDDIAAEGDGGAYSGKKDRLERLEKELAGLASAPAEPTDFAGMSFRVYTRAYGDACHVVRMVGSPPEGGRRPDVLYLAWVRAGNVVVTVALGGDLPQDDLDPTMDKLLGTLSVAAENLAD